MKQLTAVVSTGLAKQRTGSFAKEFLTVGLILVRSLVIALRVWERCALGHEGEGRDERVNMTRHDPVSEPPR